MATAPGTPGGFARGFKLHLDATDDGAPRVLDGAQFPSGRCIVDDRAMGIVQITAAVEILTDEVFAGARVEWAEEDGT